MWQGYRCPAISLVRCRLVAVHIPTKQITIHEVQYTDNQAKNFTITRQTDAYIFRVAEGRVATIPSMSLVSLT
jgi:hypothetical protein